jgi:CcmD family protein
VKRLLRTQARAIGHWAPAVLAALALMTLTALPAVAQADPDPLGTRGLGRPYLHVFLAYSVAILFIGGWVISIARRLARIERRLADEP